MRCGIEARFENERCVLSFDFFRSTHFVTNFANTTLGTNRDPGNVDPVDPAAIPTADFEIETSGVDFFRRNLQTGTVALVEIETAESGLNDRSGSEGSLKFDALDEAPAAGLVGTRFSIEIPSFRGVMEASHGRGDRYGNEWRGGHGCEDRISVFSGK